MSGQGPSAGARRYTSLNVRVGVAVIATVAVVGLLAGVLLRAVSNLRDTAQAATRTEQVLNSLDQLEQLAVDMETGVRGYVITARASFLAPYERSRSILPIDSRDLESRLAGSPAVLASARRLAASVGAYDRDYVVPVIALVQHDPAAARTVAVTQAGKDRIDQIREQARSILDVEGALQLQRQTAARASARHALTLGLIVLGVLLALVGALAVMLHRTVVRPLGGLLAGVEALARDELDKPVPQGGASEVSRVGAAVNRLATSLSESREQLHQRNAELAEMAAHNLLLLDSVYDQTPVGLAFLDPELRFVRVNEALAAIDSRPVSEHVGRPLAEFLTANAEELIARLRDVVAGGEPVHQYERVDPGPPLRVFSIEAHAVRHDGQLLGVGMVVVDVTDARLASAARERALAAERNAHEGTERSRRRAAFLAEASAVLDASLDLDATLSAFSRLAVPRVADWCAVDVVDENGRLRNVAVAHVDPDRLALAREFQRRYPPDAGPVTGSARVTRSGQPELYEIVTEEMLRAGARDEDELMFASGLGMTSVMIVPMIARGRTLGAITFVAAGGERHFDHEDLIEARELGRRAALAVDTARLYRARAETARVLQMSLLPPELPAIENFQLASRFRAAGEGALVGGDFYDVFPTGPKTWAIAIGDVCGKGAPAAAVTALARYTVRALASESLTPGDVLRALNETVLRQLGESRFLTLVYLSLDLRGPRPLVRVGCAGHPPPILVAARGPARPLPVRGTLLGVVEDLHLEEHQLHLSPGDALVLYSDGVTEADRSDLLTPERLAEVLAPSATAEALVSSVDSVAARGGADLPDDVAIVALRYAPLAHSRRGHGAAVGGLQTRAASTVHRG